MLATSSAAPAFGTRGRDALFVAGGQRGDKTVLVALTGAQIKAYVTLLGGGEKYNQTTGPACA
ncbi:MAG: hypothetical protein HS122_07995 [Opitutaceae bacterium]|nr:hypothetical protein [Opitutaceae bacterium]